MPYRVIIAASSGRHGDLPAGTYVTHNNSTGPAYGQGWLGRIDRDRYSFHLRADAEVLRNRISRLFPTATYEVVGQWNAADWDRIAARYQPVTVAPDDDDEDDDEELVHCATCGDEGHDEDDDDHHPYYSCEDCGWNCDVRECDMCLNYSEGFGGSLCADCYSEHEYDDEGGCEGSPGLALRRCTSCDSYDVHHDDVAERFVCDCEARRLVADRRPVTLARPLPTLEAVA